MTLQVVLVEVEAHFPFVLLHAFLFHVGGIAATVLLQSALGLLSLVLHELVEVTHELTELNVVWRKHKQPDLVAQLNRVQHFEEAEGLLLKVALHEHLPTMLSEELLNFLGLFAG